LQTNLGHVLGPAVEPSILNQVARQVFYHTIRGYYDFFRALRLSPEELADYVDYTENSQAALRCLASGQRGGLIVFPHLGNFDLAGQIVGLHVSDLQVLTLPNPSPTFRLFNELRSLRGIQVTPLSSAALRQAIQVLRRGGVVSVAVDRPVSALDESVSFFGLPSRVPSAHVRLALKTDALAVVACCVLCQETGRYTIHVEPPLELVRTGDRKGEIEINVHRMLRVVEAAIRRWPEQWKMFVPVWPELLVV
jgi:KDO2-lipid IV(A) lauroyltransferase